MKAGKRNFKLPACVRLLDERLWAGADLPGRSVEITPLFIERYTGPRTDQSRGGHEFWELTCVLRGEEALDWGGRSALRRESVCLIPPRVAHREVSRAPVDTIWIGFRGNRMPAAVSAQPQVVESRILTTLIEQLWWFAEGAAGPAGPELDAMTAQIVTRFLRLRFEQTREPTTDALDQAIEFLVRRHAETLHIGEVAKRFGFSEGYFYRKFKGRTGVAPNLYLTRLRLQNAMRLLRDTSLPVGEIAVRVGFEDPFYFSRTFKKMTRQNPRAYRQGGVTTR